MRRAARVDHAAGIGQGMHQLACATRMIEVHVCQENVVDVTSVEILLAQCVEE